MKIKRSPVANFAPRAAPPPPNTRVRVLVVVVVVLFVALIGRSVDPFGWFEPAAEVTVAASGEATLLELREAAELTAATGTFSVPVTVDAPRGVLRERLPEFVDSEQIIALYQGEVAATIDLSGLTADGITADPVTQTITLEVPAPQLSSPRIDHARSRIVTHQRGVLQRIDDALGDGSLAVKEDLDRAAIAAIAEAAADSGLQETARINGTRFLISLCQGLGYSEVTVEYAETAR